MEMGVRARIMSSQRPGAGPFGQPQRRAVTVGGVWGGEGSRVQVRSSIGRRGRSRGMGVGSKPGGG